MKHNLKIGILEDNEQDALLAEQIVQQTIKTAKIESFLDHTDFLRFNQKNPHKLDVLISDLGPFSLMIKNTRINLFNKLNPGDIINPNLHDSIFSLMERIRKKDLKMILFTGEDPESFQKISTISKESQKLIQDLKTLSEQTVFGKTHIEAYLNLSDALRAITQ